ncbi:MAG: hypothetical protein PHP32_02320 [Candidatus Izemoplasmatales bacterium]|nr:hypothetical protein [Candidatus Izemoplasmatales bacterium]
MKKLANVLGQLFGFLTILLYAFLFANTIFQFTFVDSSLIAILETVKLYAIFAVCGLAGLELVAGKKFFAFLYFIILAFVIIFSFFPEISQQITDLANNFQ